MVKRIALWVLFILFYLSASVVYAQIQVGQDINGDSVGLESGWSVSMPDSSTLAIGARNDHYDSLVSHVSVYRLKDSVWQQKGSDILGKKLRDGFGYSVSMPDSNTLAIGATLDYIGGMGRDSGYVSIYSWDGSEWQQKGGDIKGEEGGELGFSVSMSDFNTIAISAPYAGYNSPGHVKIYRWNGNAWRQKGSDIDGIDGGEKFGWSISMPDSNTVAIGAPFHHANGGYSGHVQVYRWYNNSWQQKGLDIDGEASFDNSGYSVSMPDSNTLAIGAPGSDENGINSGQVRIYQWKGGAWQQKGINIDGLDSEMHSGMAVSMPDSNTVAISASQSHYYLGDRWGYTRIFSWIGNKWQQKGINITGDTIDYLLGASVCMPNSNTVAIGEPWRSENVFRSGQVKVYSFCTTIGTISPIACNSFTSPSSKFNWTNSGWYVDTIPNALGCDSIISINLTIIDTISKTDVVMACDSFIWIDSLTYFSSTNSPTFTISNNGGCDTVVTLDLTINNSNTGVHSVAACDSFKWIDNVLYTSSTDTATFTLTNAAGCDSVVTLDLSITSVDTSIIKENDTLIANQSAATYQWLNCDSSFSEVSGENSQSLKPENSGSYACEITLNGCVDTTSCYRVTIASIEEEPLSFEFKIHPNPVGDFLSIEIGSLVQNASMRIRNVNGQLVYENSNLREGNNQVNVSNWAKGVYFVRIIGDDFDKAVKIVKQ